MNATTPHLSCCVKGDACLPGGLCRYTHSQKDGSGFYAGACTDPSFPNPYCSRICQQHTWPDVQYNSSRGLWSCCSDNDGGGPDCTRQTSDTFNLAPPQDLLSSKYFEIPATGFPFTTTSETSSSTTSPTSTSSTSSTPSNRPSGGELGSSSLSIGAAAGIGIGAGLGVIGVAGLAIWYHKRKRRRVQQEGPHGHHEFNPQTPVSTNGPQRVWSAKPELTGQGLPRELPA